jgi:hypothetical protein
MSESPGADLRHPFAEVDGWCQGYLHGSRGNEPHSHMEEPLMGIGASVFLLAIGAILAFAVNASVSGVDINVVGFILMVAGAIGLLMTTLVFGRRDTAGVVTEERVVRDRGVI